MTMTRDLIEFLEQPEPEFPGLKFRFAKTMAHIPHAYVVRSSENEDEYVRLFHRIGEEGSLEQWKDGRSYRYLTIGPFKYWRMTDDLSKSWIINRAKA